MIANLPYGPHILVSKKSKVPNYICWKNPSGPTTTAEIRLVGNWLTAFDKALNHGDETHFLKCIKLKDIRLNNEPLDYMEKVALQNFKYAIVDFMIQWMGETTNTYREFF